MSIFFFNNFVEIFKYNKRLSSLEKEYIEPRFLFYFNWCDFVVFLVPIETCRSNYVNSQNVSSTLE